MKDHAQFKAIFSDAQVLDIDFSAWDRGIRLCVVGLDAEFPIPKKLPIFLVDFCATTRFACTFRHSGVALDDPEHHFQWNIQDFTIDQAMSTNGLSITLVGAGVSPNLALECTDYEISRLPHTVLDDKFPGWRAPYGPLVRPGIVAESRRSVRRRKV